ncbi:hypothetical protein DL93DRAFT_1784078 [Clavulina sp. PMI_390]|nr:hypothetical protein DL93DRAFT_1784078 [Clavulina sp. PMI_390]
MLNCRDAMFGGGSAPNTLAGAARLSEPHTVMSLLKSKLSFGKTSTPGSQSRGSISYASREQFASLDRAYGATDGKARPGDRRPSMSLGLGRAPKYTPSAGPEGRQPQSPSYLSGNHHVQFPRRGSADRESTYSMTEFDGRSRFGQQSKIDEEIPVSPTTAEMKTTSELLPGAKGWSADDLQSEDIASPFVVTPPAPTAARNS